MELLIQKRNFTSPALSEINENAFIYLIFKRKIILFIPELMFKYDALPDRSIVGALSMYSTFLIPGWLIKVKFVRNAWPFCT